MEYFIQKQQTIYFSQDHIDHSPKNKQTNTLMDHKIHLKKIERIEIIQSVSFNNNGIKVEINRILARKLPNIWQLNNT